MEEKDEDKKFTAGHMKKRSFETIVRKKTISKLEPQRESFSLKKAALVKGMIREPTRTSGPPDTSFAGSSVKAFQKPRINPSKAASDIKQQEVKKPALDIKTQEVKKPALDIKKQEVKKPAPDIKTQEVKKPAPDIKKQEVKKPAPVIKLQEVKKAAPDIKNQEVAKPAPDIKKQEVRKPAPSSAPSEVMHEGHYELNERMTRIVETELQDIMIKVWQELPDNPLDDAEALVVNKLRNKAGDYLRNVLGLNITKRLLNVYNPLLVKVQFSGKPEKIHLGEFLKKYNFTTFKRLEQTVNSFAAQVKTINDFDNICSTKDVRCGNVKVTVTPMYRFTKCPPNLKTSFYDKDEDETAPTTETSEHDASKNSDQNNTEENTEKNAVNVTNKTENISQKIKVEAIQNVPAENVENKLAVEVVSKPNEKTPIMNKDKVEIDTKKTITKPDEKKTVVNKSVIENKVAVNKTQIENNAALNKAQVENKEVKKPAVANKTTVSKPAVTNKPDLIKSTVENTAAVTASLENKQIVKTNAKNVATKKPDASPVKTQTKVSAKTNFKPKESAVPKTNKVERDNDELDDHDILALMSEGIVLDECSGSDED